MTDRLSDQVEAFGKGGLGLIGGVRAWHYPLGIRSRAGAFVAPPEVVCVLGSETRAVHSSRLTAVMPVHLDCTVLIARMDSCRSSGCNQRSLGSPVPDDASPDANPDASPDASPDAVA